MTFESLSEWSNESTQDLKLLTHYGTPRWSSLSASNPLAKDIDLGTDWDLFESASIVRILLTNWAEQETDELAFWVPVLFYHLLLPEEHTFSFDTQPFAKHFLGRLAETAEAVEQQFGIGYAKLLGRAGGHVASRLTRLQGAMDVSICAAAFRIMV